jgi:adenylate cyclase
MRSAIKATVCGAQTRRAAYDLYEARIQGYQKNPPPEDCNGAFALPTK